MFIDGGGMGLPSVSGESYTVKIMPVTAGDVSGYTAQEIMELFQGLDPESVAQAGAAHTAAAGKLADLANAVSTHVSRLQANWGGQAASSAVDAFSKLQSSATQLATAAKQTGTVLTTLGTSVLPEYKAWTTQVPSGSAGTSKAAVTAAQQMQTQANFAAQQKLAELNDALVSANGALPSTIKISLPKLGNSAGTASLPTTGAGGAGGGTVGPVPTPGGSTGGGGGKHAAPTPTAPTPTSPTPTTPAPIRLSGNPPPGTPPGTGTGVGTPPGTSVGSAPGTGSGPGSGGTGPGSFFPGGSTSTSTSGNGTPGTGTPGQDDSVPPGDEVGVGGDVPGVPGSVFPGTGGIGPMGSMPPGSEPASQSGFSTPGMGNGVGEGVVPPDESFGVVPGDTAVIGPDGMIGVPGSPMGGFAGESGVNGFAGGGIADGNVAAGGVAGADGVGGAGGSGMPMGGGVGGSNNEKDRYRQAWMNEDAELWNGGVPMVPSLIGR